MALKDKLMTLEDFKAVRDVDVASNSAQFTGIKADLDAVNDDTESVGINLFNSKKAHMDAYIKATGEEGLKSNFYCSEYIEVEPSTEYKLAVGLGSNSFLTCAYYDSSKELIDTAFASNTSAFVFTTPQDCVYIRINGSSAKLTQQKLAINYSGLSTIPSYQKVIDGKSTQGVFLISAKDIFYDKSNGQLKSTEAIYLNTPQSLFSLGNTVDVGTAGGFLCWNKKTGKIYTTTSRPTNKNVYVLGVLSASKAFEPKKRFCTIDAKYPILSVDLINNRLSITVRDAACYIIYDGCFYSIPAGYTQTILLEDHCLIYFDPVATVFAMTNSFSQYELGKGIPVLVRYGKNVVCRVPYETPISNVSHKSMVCYGDSLTWYDGNDYTWGEHEGEECIGYERYLLNYLNLKSVTNRGVSGKTTPEICTKIKTASDLASIDIMTIMGGDNDDRLSVSVGQVASVGGTFDTETVYGALQSAIEFALSENPNLRIVLMTEPMGWTYRNGSFVRVNNAIPQAYRDIANLYGLPIVDLWHESGINEATRGTYYADPETNHSYFYHPNNDGWKRISKLICKKIAEV